MNVHSYTGWRFVERSGKRDEIIRAALGLIAEHGFHGAPMAMIAEKADVGAGTIYRYFESKDELVAALYRELEGEIVAFVLAGYGADRPLRERFVHIGTSLLRYYVEHPLEFKFMEQFRNSPYGVAMRMDKLFGRQAAEEKTNMFKELLDEAIASQVIKGLPLPVLSALFFGPLFDILRDHILGYVRLDGSLMEKTVAACWDSLKL